MGNAWIHKKRTQKHKHREHNEHTQSKHERQTQNKLKANTNTQTQEHRNTKQTQTQQTQPHKTQTQITANTRPTTSKDSRYVFRCTNLSLSQHPAVSPARGTKRYVRTYVSMYEPLVFIRTRNPDPLCALLLCVPIVRCVRATATKPRYKRLTKEEANEQAMNVLEAPGDLAFGF